MAEEDMGDHLEESPSEQRCSARKCTNLESKVGNMPCWKSPGVGTLRTNTWSLQTSILILSTLTTNAFSLMKMDVGEVKGT